MKELDKIVGMLALVLETLLLHSTGHSSHDSKSLWNYPVGGDMCPIHTHGKASVAAPLDGTHCAALEEVLREAPSGSQISYFSGQADFVSEILASTCERALQQTLVDII